MKLLSITAVADKHKIPRKTVESAVQQKYLKSLRNLMNEHLIAEVDADFYVKGPPFPYWWSFQQIASLGIPIAILYTLKDRYEFDYQRWKKNLYAYIPGEKGIEHHLRDLHLLIDSTPMMQMEEPPIE